MGSSTFGRAILALSILALGSVAIAQDVSFDDFFLIGDSPVLMIMFVVGVVKWLRGTTLFGNISGEMAVAVMAVIVGAVLGVAVDIFDEITVAPFNEYPALINGAIYGAFAGFTGFVGVNLYDLGVARFFKMRARATGEVLAEMNGSMGGATDNPNLPRSERG